MTAYHTRTAAPRPGRRRRPRRWCAPAGSSPGRVSDDLRTLHQIGGRQADAFYRDRWSHDKVVRSTHGVNCTGSCSWKVYVKDGIITWEAQQTDYPSVGAGPPGVRAARLPARRRLLLVHLLAHPGALPLRPRRAAARCTARPRRGTRRPGAGLGATSSTTPSGPGATSPRAARAAWSAPPGTRPSRSSPPRTCTRSRSYGPDRVAGFSPIPAMSMVSHAAGARFVPLIGGSMLSFYDWYADLPVASPQVFGDQTDVPESGDWWDAGYLIMWGSNVPVTRTPDAHWMAEARYRGQKVVAVAPDYADNVKFADEWLPAAARHRRRAGDGDGARHPQGVLRRPADAVLRRLRASSYTDLPFLVTPGRRRGDGACRARASSSPPPTSGRQDEENAAFKTVLLDAATGEPVVPNGSLGYRFGDAGRGPLEPRPRRRRPAAVRCSTAADEPVAVDLPRFDTPDGGGGGLRARRAGPPRSAASWSPPSSTCCSRSTASAATGLPGTGPPATTTPPSRAPRPGRRRSPGARPRPRPGSAREFAANAEESGGRSMIIMGAGTNHWFHSDTIYRAFLALTTLTGCQGVNGGGWAHYVGQEKVRPITG